VRGPDSTFLVEVSHAYKSNIHVVSVATGIERQLTFQGANTDPSWSNYRRVTGYQDLIAFSSLLPGKDNFDIYMMSAIDGSNLTQITENKGDDIDPVWAPGNGQLVNGRLAYSNLNFAPLGNGLPPGKMPTTGFQDHAQITLHKLDLGTGQDDIVVEGNALEPSWSQDRTTISFSYLDEEGWPGIKRLNVATGLVTFTLKGEGGYWSSSQGGL
jgi:Tol biopolymer transport system component